MTIIIPNCNTTCLKEKSRWCTYSTCSETFHLLRLLLSTSTVWRQLTQICVSVCPAACLGFTFLRAAQWGWGATTHCPPLSPDRPRKRKRLLRWPPASVHTPPPLSGARPARTEGHPPATSGAAWMMPDVAVPAPPGAARPPPLLASGNHEATGSWRPVKKTVRKGAIAFSAIPLSFSAT